MLAAIPALVEPPASRAPGPLDAVWGDKTSEVAHYALDYGAAPVASVVQVVSYERRTDTVRIVRLDETEREGPCPTRTALTVRVARSDPGRLVGATHSTQGSWGSTFTTDPVGSGPYADDAVLAEQLLLALRAQPLERGERTLPLAGGTRPSVTIHVGDDETVETGLGAMKCARVDVGDPGAPWLQVWVGREASHAVARWKQGGDEGVLEALERR